MPLLKKSFKGSQSQTSNSKFKVPYSQQKHKIKDLIDDNTVHDTKKTYHAFTRSFSQKEVINGSSSLKTREFSHEKENTYDQKTAGEIGNGNRFEIKGKTREFCFNREDSLSQEELNKPKVKSAYIEFMKKNLTKENGIQKDFVRHGSPMNLYEESLFKNGLSEINLEEDTPLSRDKNNTVQNLTEKYSQTEASKVNVKSKGKSGKIDRKHSMNKLKSCEDYTTDDELFNLSQEISTKHSFPQSYAKVNNEERNPELHTKQFCKEKKEKRAKPTRGKRRNEMFPSESADSFSQEILNDKEVKAAYIEFMNKSLAKEKETNKKRNFVLYSSSEDLFNEFETEERTPKKRKKDSTLKIYSPKRARNEKTKSPKNSQANKKHKKKSQDHVTNRQDDNSDEFPGLTLEEKMVEIYKKRNVGLYALCDICDKARFLPHTVDPLDLPDKWYCHMNPDKKHNKCSDPEDVEENQEFLIDNLYNAGSIVFVKMDGFPWWPAMVEDDPDTESYFWLEGDSMKPTFYHTTFFDSADVTRAWIRNRKIKPFKRNLLKRDFQVPEKSKYRSRLTAAYRQAENASTMPLIDRLLMYGFVKRYKKRGNEKKSKKATHGKKNKVMQSEEEESGILSDINLSDLSFNFLD